MILKHTVSEILEKDLSWQTTYQQDYQRYQRAIAGKYITHIVTLFFIIGGTVLIVEALNTPSLSVVLWLAG